MIAMLVSGCHLCALRNAASPSAEPHEPVHRTGTFDPMVVSFIDTPDTRVVMHWGSPPWHGVVPSAIGAVAEPPIIAPVQFENSNEDEPVASTSISDGQDLWTTSVASLKASIEARWEPESNAGDYFGCSVRLVPNRGNAYEIEIAWCSEGDPARRARLISTIQNALLTQLPATMRSTMEYSARTVPLSFERGNAQNLSPGDGGVQSASE
jgi:hypothetical protein